MEQCNKLKYHQLFKELNYTTGVIQDLLLSRVGKIPPCPLTHGKDFLACVIYRKQDSQTTLLRIVTENRLYPEF